MEKETTCEGSRLGTQGPGTVVAVLCSINLVDYIQVR